MQSKKIITCLLTALACADISHAANNLSEEFSEAFKNGKPTLDFRLRYENALQRPLKDARATTLRTTLGYETAELRNSKIKLELVDVANFFGQRYNPGVSDLNKPNYSVIQDPRGAGITEGKITYTGFTQNSISLGRQYIQLNNERFIGKNDFRQFPQSFDALSINSTMIDTLDIMYGFLTNVNTNFANGRGAESRRSLRTHLLNIHWNGYKYANISGYAYLNKDRSLNTNSHSVFGVRATGLPGKNEENDDFNYTAELATQHSKFNNPNHYRAYYAHFCVNKRIEPIAGTIGIERLSGSSSGSGKSFITPLASVDNFNGMAHVFTTTPARGLLDTYATLSAGTAEITFFATYHIFRLDKGPGSKRAGQEIDVGADFELNQQFDLSAAFARYNPSNSVAPKTRRIWVMLKAHLL